MRKVAVVSVGRSDFGIYQSVLKQIQQTPELKLQLIVGGMHLSPEFGLTINHVKAAGYEPAAEVDLLVSADTPQAIAKSMGLGMIGFADAYVRLQPDVVVVLGDRFEMHAAASAAVPFKIPLAHIHGGEVTEGAIDDAFRHGITKYAHLHFTSTPAYARRVMQLGEEPWRVTVSGAPGLDAIAELDFLTREELADRVGVALDVDPLLVTFHPVTLQYEQTSQQTQQLMAALDDWPGPIIFTRPNADTNGRLIATAMAEFCTRHPLARVVDNLGMQAYFSLMKFAAAMVGNSSSGIIEAPSFELPVVNIGVRQAGRVRCANVIDVDSTTAAIVAGLKRATSADFRLGLSGMVNQYGTGNAAKVIIDTIANATLDERLLMKRFHDLASSDACDKAA